MKSVVEALRELAPLVEVPKHAVDLLPRQKVPLAQGALPTARRYRFGTVVVS